MFYTSCFPTNRVTYEPSTIIRRLVILMMYDSFCFFNKKTSSAISYHLEKTCCKNTHREQISSQQFDIRSTIREKHGWVIEKNMLSVNWMNQQPTSEARMLLICCGCKTNCATKRCSCISQELSCTDGCRCSDICQDTNQRESLSERDSESDNEEED